MNVLVTGNGFDIDLGLNTRYSDFIKSSHWRELIDEYKGTNCMLSDFLFTKADILKDWFNLEDCLADYIREQRNVQNDKNIEIDKVFFEELKSKLYMFIEYAWCDKGLEANKDSIAYKIYTKGNFTKCYTFNYTWYDAFMPKMLETEYLHGEWGKIVVGIGEYECINEKYSFLVKSNTIAYPKTNVVRDLIIADEVVIFGHSFCERDSGIFKRLLEECRDDIYSPKERRITIITKDEESIHRIKMLFHRWGYSFDVLYSLCQITFVATEQSYHNNPIYVSKMEKVLERLSSQ